MNRFSIHPRPDWQKTVEDHGFTFHSNGERPTPDSPGTNWRESAYYEFTMAEIDDLESSTEELHRMCLSAVAAICDKPELMNRLCIPANFHDMVRRSWRDGHPYLYGRMDLAYDGDGPPKLLEYNADTPTALIESSVIQWFWMKDVFNTDQFNSIHEKLINRWAAWPAGLIHFSAYADSIEELATTEYLRDLARQAGADTEFVSIGDVGWDGRQFVDVNKRPIKRWFKLYPWEWLLAEQFGANLIDATDLYPIEPAWKMVLSNKGILPILWELFPGHKNLLPAFFEPQTGVDMTVKPIHGREGANILMRRDGSSYLSAGPYSGQSVIYQQTALLKRFGTQFSTIGSWIVGDRSAGICVREDDTPIINGESAIVPHVIV